MEKHGRNCIVWGKSTISYFGRILELIWPYVDAFGPCIGPFEATLEPLMAVSGLLMAILEPLRIISEESLNHLRAP